MRHLLQKYKPVLIFVALFLGTYFSLSALYLLYLNLAENGNYFPDFITELVARQSNDVINSLGYTSAIYPDVKEPVQQLHVNGKYLARIIEGCNSISVIILFSAFIIAFAKKFKKTILYIFAGSVMLYIINIFRIVLLAIALYEYPAFENVLHTVLFPAIIYGLTFLLWIFWVRMLPKPTKST